MKISTTELSMANAIAEETYQNITGNPVQSSTQLIPMAKQGPNLIQCKTCIFDGRRECIEHGYPDDCIKQSCEFKIGILAVIDPIEAQMRNREHDRAIEQAARDDERKRYACNLETIRPPKDCFSHFEGYNSIKCKGCSQWGYCADITVRCTAAREDEQRKWRDDHPADLVWMTPEEEEARIRGDERERLRVVTESPLFWSIGRIEGAMRDNAVIRSELDGVLPHLYSISESLRSEVNKP